MFVIEGHKLKSVYSMEGLRSVVNAVKRSSLKKFKPFSKLSFSIGALSALSHYKVLVIVIYILFKFAIKK